jgi:hypothetical protein
VLTTWANSGSVCFVYHHRPNYFLISDMDLLAKACTDDEIALSAVYDVPGIWSRLCYSTMLKRPTQGFRLQELLGF